MILTLTLYQVNYLGHRVLMVWGFCWINLEICQIQNLTPDQIIISPCNSISIKSVSDAVC